MKRSDLIRAESKLCASHGDKNADDGSFNLNIVAELRKRGLEMEANMVDYVERPIDVCEKETDLELSIEISDTERNFLVTDPQNVEGKTGKLNFY